jgi:hypothetical protein
VLKKLLDEHLWGRKKASYLRMLLLAASFSVAAIACATWYWFAVRYNRRRAGEVARWIESALAGQGHVTGIRWVSSSRFQVPLRLGHSMFRRASVLVEMSPCDLPLHWLLGKLRAHQEVLTFQADLDLPPVFSLHVQNFRWFARSSRKSPKNDRGWIFERTTPVVVSTRSDWQKEVSSAISSLAQGQSHDFLTIDFQRRSPHFCVTLPLDAIAPGSPTRTCVFESMRELASNSSASLF